MWHTISLLLFIILAPPVDASDSFPYLEHVHLAGDVEEGGGDDKGDSIHHNQDKESFDKPLNVSHDFKMKIFIFDISCIIHVLNSVIVQIFTNNLSIRSIISC